MRPLLLIFTNARYFAPSWVFASVNILFGTWAIYIPTVQANLGIDKSELGIAIFFLSLGVFTVFPFASRIIDKMGAGRATRAGILLSSGTALLPFLAPNYYMLALSLFLFGASNGFTDISMNTLVAEIEKEDRQKFMSASHGFFSLGGVLAGLGSFLIGPLDNAPLHMGLAVVLVLTVNGIFCRHYKKVAAPPEGKKAFNLGLFRPLLLLGLVSFVSMGSEGAIVDWSGLYLKEVALAPQFLWGTGFLGFQAAMTLGRFFGDGISSKIGSLKMIILASILAVLGYVLVLVSETYTAIAGFALAGLGFSVIVPEVFRIGGNVNGIDSSQGISFIAGTGYAGFLMAPPIFGFIANTSSLYTCFLLLLGCAFVILGSAFVLDRQKN